MFGDKAPDIKKKLGKKHKIWIMEWKFCYNDWDKPSCKSPHPLVKHCSAEEVNPRYDVEGGKHADMQI